MSRSRLLILSALLRAFLLFLTCCHARNKKISRGYKIRALVQKPGNFTLAGEVGARCLFNFNEWNPSYETEQDISHEELISIVPRNVPVAVGEVFRAPNEELLLKLLRQLDPGVRRSRYDPLDPNARSSAIAYGILQSSSRDEFHFMFR